MLSEVTFGIYQGARLNYYNLHIGGKLPSSLEFYKDKECPLALTAKLVDTDKGVDVYVQYKGKPLAGKKVTLFCSDGHEEGAGETDKEGKISFSDKEVEDGLNGIMVGFTDKEESGNHNGKEYKGAAHYLTITFNDPEDFKE